MRIGFPFLVAAALASAAAPEAAAAPRVVAIEDFANAG